MGLRPYQLSCQEATKNFVRNESGHGLIVAECSAGKSLMMADIAEWLYENGVRPLILADRSKLIEQNAKKFSLNSHVGVVSAGLDKREYDAPIVVGGIQTLYNKSDLLGDVDFILADEGEAIGNNFESDSRYHQFLRCYPNARLLLYTATPYTLAEGGISYAKTVHEITYQDLLNGDFCVPLTNKLLDMPDLSDVKHTGEEFNLVALGEYMRQNELVQSAAKKTAEYIRNNNRKKTLGFCVDLEHAYQMAIALKQYGLNADMVAGSMDEAQREMHYHDFEHGDTDVLLNVEILTKGADFPCIDCIAMYRPTESMRLYFQMLGRGIRLYKGKTECLLLDFTGNLSKFGTLGNPIWRYFGSEKKKVGKALKVCPACEEAVNIGRETCSDCGYIFLKEDIIKELKHEAEADTKSDMSKAKSVERIYTIGYIDYSDFTSSKGNRMMKVTYHSGSFSCNEFPPFGNPAYWAKKKVQEFMRGRSNVIPTTLESALKLAPTWRKPKVMRFKPQEGSPKYYQPAGVVEWQSEEISNQQSSASS